MFEPMCNNPNNARLNRERVKQGITNRFHAEQARAVAQWRLGEPKPELVILGELPYVGQNKQRKREED